MGLLARIRGVLGAAAVWSLPWAFAGGLLWLTYGVLRAPSGLSFSVYVVDGARIFQAGALLIGSAGAIAGGIFGAALIWRGRNRSLTDLTPSRVAALGAASGAGAIVVPMLVMAVASPRSPFLLLPVAAIAALMGAASAAGMVAIARHGSRQPAEPLAAGGKETESLGQANAEVDQLLADRLRAERRH